jgi:uncharacterized YccA/Bax inhibitor family protein
MDTSNPLLRKGFAYSGDAESTRSMNLEGVVNKTGILVLLCLGAGAFSWAHPELRGIFIPIGLLGGFIACLVGTFAPSTAPISAPFYAILEGLCIGAISQSVNLTWSGIMVNALLLTFGVLALMLVLYVTRVVRVTSRFAMGVLMATGAIAMVYLVDMVMRMFGAQVPYIHECGTVGIVISLVIVGIAAFNLLVDFAVIESNISQGAPKFMEWYCGMALLVTLVWLYLELLRLLSKIRSR